MTGRYPRGIFDFNVGVLRWTWRVQYYAIGAFATDRYPPFTLEDDPGYPAHFDVEYPQQLSRGLVLVKWWLLAIPHYLIVSLFIGGTWVAYHFGGLVSVLTVIAGVIVLLTGSYPRSVYDFVLGMNRWVLRVAAYASLMTDEYPPFRLDMGGTEGWPEPPATADLASPERTVAGVVRHRGFPGFVSKLWLADDERGRYRGVYEWDGPRLAENYARALWRVLALVSRSSWPTPSWMVISPKARPASWPGGGGCCSRSASARPLVGGRDTPAARRVPRRPGGPRAGERLPDQLVTSAGRSIRLHDLLATPGVHILLDRDAPRLDALPRGRLVDVHRLASVPGRGLLAVRPDGYIGFCCENTEVGQLAAWLTRLRAWQPEAETMGPPGTDGRPW